MPQYFSPGVYVEEVASGVKPIAGVATSTAGFIGVIDDATIPSSATKLGTDQSNTIATGTTTYTFTSQNIRAITKVEAAGGPDLTTSVKTRISADGTAGTIELKAADAQSHNGKSLNVTFQQLVPAPGLAIPSRRLSGEVLGAGDGNTSTFELKQTKALPVSGLVVSIDGSEQAPSAYDFGPWPGTLDFETPPPANQVVSADYVVNEPFLGLVPAGEVVLCTSFSDFRSSFGDFSAEDGQRLLAHAVYGFFNNGGARCYVAWVGTANQQQDIESVLEKFRAIDEIALVAAPGQTNDPTHAVAQALADHCASTKDRFALLDCERNLGTAAEPDLTLLDPTHPGHKVPAFTLNAAFYFPWIEVFDPAQKLLHPESDGTIPVPPSGHLAGIYARVDQERGVFKAPANESVRGALGVAAKISRAQQDGLNPNGINVIRELGNRILVWGARTLGGDHNSEWKYINVRRSALFLEESIDEGTQWAVFEPNDPSLWAKISRNVTAFLTNFWRQGGLFGSKPEEAFYVKCDAETNPPDVRERGEVIAEVGLALVRPAEFVVFRVSQWAGAGQ